MFSQRHKPRNASLAIQQDKYIKKQVQLSKKESKPRYLTPKKQNQSFQARLLDLPIISSSPKNQLCVTQIFTQTNEKERNPYIYNWNQKFDALLCGTLRTFNLTKEQKLFNKSFSFEEQQEIIKSFKQKAPPLVGKKPKVRQLKKKEFDKEFVIDDISQYFNKIQD
ncbi:unnamed protein product (macronuclear) [Paramecium tetraurelia]|uniref:Uncharacterized protein n=1 Tax=Paramecium tetraurelia TaxID=5888 RepID=A0DPL5_PARTE|nr:uncharacterized protein GSPATT00019164001 [Paramecium tetraurelia]CAK84982.1 unnamed protein product [Paramecium tetraurelia]|eukprot:XP_001452379.1 hypothetical protein (macronuclear) [Paramecium tetraurelia strain d4-2]